MKDAVEGRPELQSVLVRGEISNLTRHASGHLYFSLKDANSQVRAVMFARNAEPVRALVKDGLEVTALGSVNVYEKRGEYQLYVTALQAAGLGAIFLEFERLKKMLAAEGLFDSARKRPIPAMPGRIAVVTSPTGAAVRDVINVITRRFPAVEVTVVPALVQGEGAPESVRRALARAQKLDGVDTVLLVRGGGSYEDLHAFNDEALARDIAACRVPVISGVGHETDFTIADFAADERAPTPSAAAERSVPDLAVLKRNCARSASALRSGLRMRVSREKERLRARAAELAPRRLVDTINQLRLAADESLRTASLHIRHRIQSASSRVDTSSQRLTALDPYAVLRRGYSVLKQAGTGKIISSVGQLQRGAEFDALVSDGSIRGVAVDMSSEAPLPRRKKRKTDAPESEELEF